MGDLYFTFTGTAPFSVGYIEKGVTTWAPPYPIIKLARSGVVLQTLVNSLKLPVGCQVTTRRVNTAVAHMGASVIFLCVYYFRFSLRNVITSSRPILSNIVFAFLLLAARTYVLSV